MYSVKLTSLPSGHSMTDVQERKKKETKERKEGGRKE
jgi:hypothetical protein